MKCNIALAEQFWSFLDFLVSIFLENSPEQNLKVAVV